MKVEYQCLATSLFLCALNVNAADFIPINDSNFASHLTLNRNSLVGSESGSRYVLEKSVTLPNGVTKKKYIQYYHNVPVFSSLVTSSEVQGRQHQWFGDILANIPKDLASVTPKLSEQDILALAKKMVLKEDATTYNDQVKLWIKQNPQTRQAELVYWVSFVSEKDGHVSRPNFILNASTGEVLRRWEGLATRDAQGPGGNEKTGMYYYGKEYGPLIVDDSCTMRTENVDTYNLNNRTSGEVLFQFTCPENKYKAINGAYSPINDAHYFGTVVFDMYKKWFETSPLNTKLKLRVHYSRNYDNAFWDGQQMTFGDGGSSFYPLTSLDVVAHEVSHGVTEQNSNLIYQYQSGGMNEAFSDMAGELAEFYMNSQAGKENDWMIGEAIMKGPAGLAMRYFQNPSKDGFSIEHARDYKDSLDVHHTSGVYNKAYYTLAHRSNWDIRKAFSVFLLANQTYWKSDSTFDSGACGVKKAADDLGYEAADVIASFQAVGVNANCGTTPTPNPDPDPEEPTPPTPTPIPGDEIVLKNGEIVNGIQLSANKEHRFVLTVPHYPWYPYTYKYLYIQVFNTKNNTRDLAQLYVRYDLDILGSQANPSLLNRNEYFFLNYPSEGKYHLLVKGKQTGTVSIQAFYSN